MAWVGSGGVLGSQAALGRRGVSRGRRGRRGTLWHPPSLCVAGVALDDMDRHFAWQAWHLWHLVGNLLTHNFLTYNLLTYNLLTHGSSLCVAGVARRSTYGTGLALVARLVPRPRWDAAAFCVAGVALCDIHLHFVWQAWHLSTHGSSLCVAGVALMALGWLRWRAWFPGRAGTPRRSAWQAWHLSTHGSSLCVAGVALMALGWLWWHTKLFHTTLSQIHFTHNFVTDSFHTQLCHTSLSHTTLSHTTLSHTQLCHTQLFHTQLFHTQLCHIHLFHTQAFTHNTFTYTNLHTESSACD